MAIIELDGVTREFALRDTLLGKRRVVRAVDGMSFSLEPGTAVGT